MRRWWTAGTRAGGKAGQVTGGLGKRLAGSLIRWYQDDSESGQGLVEYTLLIALVTLICFVTVTNFGGNTYGMLNRVSSSVGTIT